MTWQERRIVTFLSAVLVVLFAIVLVLLGVRYKENRAEKEAAQQSGVSTPTDDPGAYTALSYETGSFTLSFSLDENGNWIWSDDPSFPLDDTTILGITGQLASWKPQQTVTDSEVLENAGFDQPNATLTATTAHGTTTLLFGRATTDGSSYYVRLNGDETTAYILPDTLYTLLSRPIYDMMEVPELPELTEDCLLSVTIQGPAEEDGSVGPVTVLTAQQGDGVTTWRSSGANITDDPTVRALIADLTSLTITKCVDYHPSDEAASLCGFDNPTAQVTIRYTAGTDSEQALALTIGNRLEDGSGRYVRLGDDPTIYFLPTEALDPLMPVAVNGLEG